MTMSSNHKNAGRDIMRHTGETVAVQALLSNVHWTQGKHLLPLSPNLSLPPPQQ